MSDQFVSTAIPFVEHCGVESFFVILEALLSDPESSSYVISLSRAPLLDGVTGDGKILI